MTAILADLRYALRRLRRSPGFAFTAVLTLGLGLGGAVTMGTVVRTVLLSPAPFPRSAELAAVAFTSPEDKPSADQIGASADFLQQHSRSFSSTGVAEDDNIDANLSAPGRNTRPLPVRMRWVSAGYLPTLGIAPTLGRSFTPDEDRSGGPRVVLLSDAVWRGAFAADPAIVGKSVHLDEQPATVVGVMPAGFRDPSTSEPTALWAPLALSPAQPGYDGDNYTMVGRLKLGTTLAAAQAELNSLTDPFLKENPAYLRWTAPGAPHLQYRAWPLAQALTSGVRASLLTMLLAVVLVLMLACINLAGLLGTRAAERQSELQLRIALGAGRTDMLRLLVSEAVLLAVGAALLAFLFSSVALPALAAYTPVPLPSLGQAGAVERAGFLLLAALAAVFVFAGLPAAVALRTQTSLASRGAVGVGRLQTRLGAVLVAAQACLATVLLAGASLLLGAFLRLQSTSPGFLPQHLVAAQLTVHGERYDTSAGKARFLDDVLARLKQTPGVSAAAAIDGLPLERGLNIGMEPDHPTAARTHPAELRPVSPGYFSTLGLHLIAGRTLQPTDAAHGLPVAVISETAARDWWPGESPLGHQVRFRGNEPYPMQVVGIVSDTHANSLAEPFRDAVYAPYSQLPDGITRVVNRWIATSLVLRAADGVPVGRVVDNAVRAIDPELPVVSVATVPSLIGKSNRAPRFFSLLASGFAGFALLLASVGLFGLLSYQVGQRTRELAVRLAVGATRGHILLSVFRGGLLLVAAGLAAGLAASTLVPPFAAGVLADVVPAGGAPPTALLPHGSLTFVLPALALLLAAALACALPAYRASRTNPMEVLRSE